MLMQETKKFFALVICLKSMEIDRFIKKKE